MTTPGPQFNHFPVWPFFTGAATIPPFPKCGPFYYTLDASGNYTGPDPSYCTGCCSDISQSVVQCNGLCQNPTATQLLIQKQRRIPSSQFMSSRSSLVVTGRQPDNAPTSANAYVNWYQGSDRALPAGSQLTSIRTVPSHGNTTKGSVTRIRPGSIAPGGKGVDAKHGSYDRFLARKKGGVLRKLNASSSVASSPIVGNKTRPFGLVSNAYGSVGKCMPVCK